ncbi:MAG: HAD hydrolase-like protein [Gulosibacter sp.]|uniref:HAD hydrolase-like protein n=1 Tax=Gulosibacter sp. TaxID=2817531 RepID=UPI003F8EA3AA
MSTIDAPQEPGDYAGPDDAPLLEEVDPEAELSLSANEASGDDSYAVQDYDEARTATRERHGGDVAHPLDGSRTLAEPSHFSPASVNVVPPIPIAPTTISRRPQPESRPITPVRMPLGTGEPPFTAILWDLDGTISDSAAGIMAALRETFDVFRMPIPDDSTLLSYVGPPIIDSFKAQHLDNQIEIQHALETYREIHDESGLAESPPFAGMPELIRAVRQAGIPQSTATSKPETPARRVLDYYGIIDEFNFVTGASDDESRSKKEDVVEEALRRLREAGVDLSNTIMVGDRFYDVQGSAQHGVPAIYVNWGYGAVGEDEGAVAVASNAHELRRLLAL